mgnify:CR=1 FL=1
MQLTVKEGDKVDQIIEDVLPIGSVVVDKEGKKKIIVGYLSSNSADDLKLYVGVTYPLGLRKTFILNKNYFLFNANEIEEVIFMGYQNKGFDNYKRLIKAVVSKTKYFKEAKIKMNNRDIMNIVLREDLKLIKEGKTNE